MARSWAIAGLSILGLAMLVTLGEGLGFLLGWALCLGGVLVILKDPR